MYMIQIEESKVEKMSELAEEMLRAGGKLMQCFDEMSSEYGERSRYGDERRPRDDRDRDMPSYGERRMYPRYR